MGNREIVAALYQAFSSRNIERVTSLTSPDLVVTQTDLLPWGGTYLGHAGLQQFAAKLYETVDSQVTVDEFIEAGANVVALGWTRGTVRKNGAPFSVRIAHVWTIGADKASRFQPYIDTPEMLRALEQGT